MPTHIPTPSSSHEEPIAVEGIARRALVRSAAWSVPLVASAIVVPAASASTTPNCTTEQGTFDWSLYARASGASATAYASTPMGGDLILALAATFGERTVASETGGPQSENPMGLSVYTVAGRRVVSIMDVHTAGAPSQAFDARYRMELTFTFSEAVSDLRFSVGDIDSYRSANGNAYRKEYVRVNAAGAQVTLGSRLIYSSDPAATGFVMANGNNVGSPDGDARNAINVYIPGPTTQFSLTVVNVRRGYNGNLTLGPLSFSRESC